MQHTQELRLAVLIDADNVPSATLKEMMEEIAKYGTPTFKRIYGDWTKPHVTRWKSLLLENAITPVQQYSYTTGKNATDSAMIIDAMDILYSGRVDGFCIISSDSDFTRLAIRLREAGMKVIGMGENKTPEPFIAACDKFIYIEILKAETEEEVKEGQVVGQEPKEQPTVKKLDKKLINSIQSSVNDLADETGWVFLGELGNLILKKQPDFDPRNYGFKKLVLLIKSIDSFEIDERLTDKGNGNIRHVYVRVRQVPRKAPARSRRPAPKPRPQEAPPTAQ
ncbi:MAG: NYN domain-containing protein [Sphingobacteriales bacterium]|nr:MAG: NYN domain-containing protein [Sphingobacteriales bacterium]